VAFASARFLRAGEREHGFPREAGSFDEAGR
jgi:hypothetical protein